MVQRKRSRTVEQDMDDLPLARGSWLPIDASAELLQLEPEKIRHWVTAGCLEVRVVEGIEFVRLKQLQETMRDQCDDA
jgi:hypothetical protein